MSHYVVLARVGRRGLVIHDPARGPQQISVEEASSHVTGVALELTPTPAFEQRTDVRRPSLWDFWHRIRRLVPFLLQLFGMALVMQIFALAAPLYSQLVVDEAIAKGDRTLLDVLAFGFTLLLLVQVTAEVLRAYVGMYFSNMLGFYMDGGGAGAAGDLPWRSAIDILLPPAPERGSDPTRGAPEQRLPRECPLGPRHQDFRPGRAAHHPLAEQRRRHA
jgi:ABC-type bacteriocin/lantibiotic exporter with double-glycine peptidase domain